MGEKYEVAPQLSEEAWRELKIGDRIRLFRQMVGRDNLEGSALNAFLWACKDQHLDGPAMLDELRNFTTEFDNVDARRMQWLISSGATITLANAISIKASDPHFRSACDLGMELAKDER